MNVLLIAAFLLFTAPPVCAQIGVDGVSSADGTTTASFSWSHTVTGSADTVLQVGCGIADSNQAATISGITYNGSALTKLLSQPASGFNAPSGQTANRTESWMILAPATGTHTIAVTLAAGAAQDAICGAMSLSRVNQSLTPDATSSSSGVASAGSGPPQPATSVTTNAAWDLVLDTVLNTGPTNPQPASPAIREWNLGTSAQAAASIKNVPTAGAVTMGWAGMTNAWSQSVVALKWDGTTSPPVTYNISPTGSDSNLGTLASPWLTPNHPVNCGDTILAAVSSSYAEANFRVGQWGPVTCIFGNNVAWLKCVTFDACKMTISIANHDAMTPSQSYWGVQGWEVTTSTPSTNQCFEAFPPDSSTQIHHIIFANNVANGCGDGGFTTGLSGSVGVDYLAIIGNIAYNAAQDNAECYSGIDIVSPVNSDNLPGTHYYIAGNFAWGNMDPNPCGGGAPTDGQGLSLDTITTAPGVQFVIDNNISVFNGGTGIQAFLNNVSPTSKVYIRQNTIFGNHSAPSNANPCGEINVFNSYTTEVYANLVQAGSNVCVTPGPINVPEYALVSSFDSTTDVFWKNFIYSALGNNTAGTNSQFVNNSAGTNPAFSNPVKPSAPGCGSFASVPACMTSVIANFTPTNALAKGYGYQVPQSASVYDPLFPQWLCNVNLPAGLVTMGCLAGGNVSGATLSGATIH
jgi:hypothetical protein